MEEVPSKNCNPDIVLMIIGFVAILGSPVASLTPTILPGLFIELSKTIVFGDVKEFIDTTDVLAVTVKTCAILTLLYKNRNEETHVMA